MPQSDIPAAFTRSSSRRTALSNATRRRPVGAVLALSMLIGAPTMAALTLHGASSAAAATEIYSPAATGDVHKTVEGSIYATDSTVIGGFTPNLGDTGLGGVKIHGYWIDSDGSVSPTYYTTSNADGTWAMAFPDWTDASGKVHTFTANITNQKIRMWSDSVPGYTMAFADGHNDIANSTIGDKQTWDQAGNQVNQFQFVYNKLPDASLQPNPLPSLAGADPAVWSKVTGPNKAETISGTVFQEQSRTSYYIDFPADDASDPGLAGIKVTATYVNPDTGVPETRYAYTDAKGRYTIQFQGYKDGIGIPHINTEKVFVSADLPSGTNYATMFPENKYESLAGIQEGSTVLAYQYGTGLNFAVWNVPSFDVLTYNNTNAPAPVGATVQTSTTGLPVGTSSKYSIKWTGVDSAGNSVDVSSFNCTNLSPDASGNLTSCPVTVPNLKTNTTFTATLYDNAGNAVQADSFIAIPMTVTTPVGGVGNAYTGSAVVPPRAGITYTYAASGLPAGLSINPTTGAITGTPTTAGTSSVTYTATGSDGSKITKTVPLTIVDVPQTLPTGELNQAYTSPTLTVATPPTGTSGTVTGVTGVTGLPAGTSFDAGTGQITGTPTVTGTFPLKVTYTVKQADGSTSTFTTTKQMVVKDTVAPTINTPADQTNPAGAAINPVAITTNDPTATTTVTNLPAGLSYDPATGKVTGTPTTPGDSTVQVKSVDPAGNTSTSSFVWHVTPDVTAPAINPIANRTDPEDAAITPFKVTSDDPKATYTAAGVPAGVTLNPDGTFSGTPTTPGTYPVTVSAKDAAGNTSTSTFTWTVSDKTPPTIKASDASGDAGSPISPIKVTVTDNSGDPVTTTVSGLPAGLSFDPSTGEITGTPTTPGSYPVTITSTDAAGNKATVTITITVKDVTPPAMNQVADRTDPQNSAITAFKVTSDDPLATYTAAGVPAGITLNTDGTFSGTPTTPGTYPVTVTAKDAAGNTSTQTFTWTVTDATAPKITPIPDQTEPQGQAITPIQVKTDDPSATTTVNGLPPGLSYDPKTGQITGTPTATGDYPVTVTSTDAAGNKSTDTFTIHVVDTTAPKMDQVADQSSTVGQAINPVKVTSDDPNATYTAKGLPDGVTLNPDGTFTGTPTTPGNYNVTVTSTDQSGNTSTQSFTWTVKPAPDTTAPVITPIADQTVEQGDAIKPITVTTDDPTATTTVTGLPKGVTYDPKTGEITGTPTTPGTYPVTVTSVDPSGNKSTDTFTITVKDTTAPKIDPIADQSGTAGQAASPITVKTDDPSATTTVSGLPDGVTYDPKTGQITGTPTTPGTYHVTVTSTDSSGNTSTDTFTWTVKPVPDTTAPVIDPVSDKTVPEDQPISPIKIGTDDPTATTTVTGLPPTLSYDPKTGEITGTPTEPGTYPVTVTSTDPAGNTSTKTFDIVVTDTTAPKMGGLSDQTVVLGDKMADEKVVTDDPSATITTSTLPDGVTFTPDGKGGGTITGTPTQAGSYPITVTATDEAGNKTTQSFTITVNKPADPADTTAPVIDPVSDKTVPEDQPISPIKIGTDDPTATTTVTGLPPTLSYDPKTGEITGTPTEPGTYPVTVTSTDPAGNTSTKTFDIVVTDTTAPKMGGLSDQTVVLGDKMADEKVVTDDPSATITTSTLPDGVTFTPDGKGGGTITGTPTQAGSYPITVTATDEAGNKTTQSFTITVDKPASDTTAPVITPIGDQTVDQGDAIKPITVKTDDPTATTTVSDLPKGVTYDPKTGEITGTPTTPGTYPVTVTSTDPAGNKSTDTFVITVKDTTAPTIAPISDQDVTKGSPIKTITVTTDDPGATITVSGLPDGVTFDPKTGEITGTPTAPGTYKVTVVATDKDGNTSTETFTITVDAPKDTTPPAITPIADQGVEAGKAIKPITVKTDDPTATTTVSDLPKGVTYDPKTGEITGTPTTPGTYPVTVTSSDPAGNKSTDTFVITVKPAPVTIAPNADKVVPVDRGITPIAVTVSSDDPSVTTTVSGLPKGLTYDPKTGQITGTPTGVGVSKVTVTSTNTRGGKDTDTFTITVVDRTAPVVTAPAKTTVPEDKPMAPIHIGTSDDSSTTTAVTGLPTGTKYDPKTGNITGTPTIPGTYPVTITVVDASGNQTTKTIVIVVTRTPAPATRVVHFEAQIDTWHLVHTAQVQAVNKVLAHPTYAYRADVVWNARTGRVTSAPLWVKGVAQARTVTMSVTVPANATPAQVLAAEKATLAQQTKVGLGVRVAPRVGGTITAAYVVPTGAWDYHTGWKVGPKLAPQLLAGTSQH